MNRRGFFAVVTAFVTPKLPAFGDAITRRRPALTINHLPPFLAQRMDEARMEAIRNSLVEGTGYFRIMREEQDRDIRFLAGDAWPA